ncbi:MULTISPECIES: helix-turn-helix domain-containing protein [Cupriavidus]|uniref:Transcription regulator HTH isolated domain n=1 Tax=Cupriavidus taiwanensis TaxID=164546 RepID=A0A976AQU0_9BURK|nr:MULTISPECIES: helix-turn-helix transcriptional regulator [Cupriavidus]MEC3766193.1 helix-turn-helix transcriptional regulator [Cupriavidus sp. SS-3]SOY97448.1 putative transcription regulator; HTH isolated domain [Cupriavidus taiwanensis]SOZ00178.1 putative transcription regulator; HTH isolated domain [Cupriavidus taiwanensis]SPD68151.1 putative transcription regulator HTH isolated domain [Cupriavidus taiwanensis]
MSLISQCRQLREARGKSLGELGRILGMAAQNLSAILLGKKDSRASTLEALAAALDAQWVLVPNERLAEVRQVLEGKGGGPDRGARAALDIFLEQE